MNNVRLKLTEDEKLAQQVVGLNGSSIHMAEGSIDKVIEKERAYKFNEELNKIAEKFETSKEQLEKNAEAFGDSIANIEIKPMFSRLLIKPLAQNPFQRVKVQNGIIVDAGVITPHAELNPNTGKYEEQKEFIKTGAVQEVGPEVKYIKPGDVIFYRVDTVVPVPFFKQGMVSLAENQVIAVVNEGLTERFNSVV